MPQSERSISLARRLGRHFGNGLKQWKQTAGHPWSHELPRRDTADMALVAAPIAAGLVIADALSIASLLNRRTANQTTIAHVPTSEEPHVQMSPTEIFLEKLEGKTKIIPLTNITPIELPDPLPQFVLMPDPQHPGHWLQNQLLTTMYVAYTTDGVEFYLSQVLPLPADGSYGTSPEKYPGEYYVVERALEHHSLTDVIYFELAGAIQSWQDAPVPKLPVAGFNVVTTALREVPAPTTYALRHS